MNQIFTNTLTGGLGNQFATVIGHGGAGGTALFGNDFATALAHGITQGAMSALRGQKFKSGFIGGIASKASDGIIDSKTLKNADPFTKASISALIGGIASKAAGGDFVEGAMSAMVVYLWNKSWSYKDLKGQAFKSKNIGLCKENSKLISNKEILYGDPNEYKEGYYIIGKSGYYHKVSKDGSFVYINPNLTKPFVESMEGLGDKAGLALSVASAVSPQGMAWRFGAMALAIDIAQGDDIGMITGVASFADKPILQAIDIGYSIYQVVK